MNLRKMILSALFIALGVMLPFLTASNPQLGSMFLPMHLPVIICGFICGPLYGGIVGLLTPLLRSGIAGMPVLIPMGFSMAVELAAYGVISGLLYKIFPKKLGYKYLALILAMIGGRLIWGIAAAVIYGASGTPFGIQMFWTGAFLNAVPGIIIQIVLIPPLVNVLEKRNMI